MITLQFPRGTAALSLRISRDDVIAALHGPRIDGHRSEIFWTSSLTSKVYRQDMEDTGYPEAIVLGLAVIGLTAEEADEVDTALAAVSPSIFEWKAPV
ncbi:MAG: hypothetical protein JSS57_17570 [Proteobacteria bacterium]|nr:hypothetical protein [Pseudomonadota bacterium]